MSWKPASSSDRGEVRGGSARRRTWSITRRLTVLYVASTLAILALASGYLYWVLSDEFEDASNAFLADSVRVLRHVLRDSPDDPAALQEQIKWEETVGRFARYYARVLGDEGLVELETPGMTSAGLHVGVFPPPVELKQVPERGVPWRSENDASFLLMSAWGELGEDGAPRQIQVAMDLSRQNALIASHGRNLAVVALMGVIGAGALGAFVARRGLRPLRELARAAHRVTASQLDERVASSHWPRELGALAREFDDMLSRLARSFRQMSEVSANIAHELRTPINNLVGEAEVALSQARTTEEYRTVLGSALEEYARLSRMIDGLLFLARAEHPETRVDRTEFDAREAVDAVGEFFDAVAEEKGVTVTCRGSGRVVADAMLFRRAVNNILSNAIRHTPRGGHVTISVVPGPAGAIEIAVADDGPGIPAEHLPRVLDRFYRADPARSGHAEGSGLGLPIVKSILDLHQGSVRIDSATGGGTTVTLTFPDGRDAAGPAPARVDKLTTVSTSPPP